MDGAVTHVAGTGRPGEVDGPGAQATFTFPNGIAAGPTGDRLHVNDCVNRFPPTQEVPPAPRSSLRQITLPSFSDLLLAAWQTDGIDALRAAYRDWKSSAGTAGIFTEVEINALGYRLRGAAEPAAATLVFELNAESYPTSFNAWDSLAEAHMNAGRRDEAIQYYRRSLSINPANTDATQMLERLGAN